MRTCPNCGHMLSEKDTICFKCGMQLSQISAPNRGMAPMPNQQMMGNRKPQPAFPNAKQPNGKKDNSSIYLVLGIIVVLAALVAVILFVTKNNKLEDEDKDNTTNNQVIINPPDPDPSPIEPDPSPIEPDPGEPIEPDPGEPIEPEPPVTDPEPVAPGTDTKYGEHPIINEGYHEVRNNGYAYAVPDEYTAKDYATKGFDILNYKKTKEMMISINIGTLANLKQTLPAVKQMYIDSGAVVHNIKVTSISGIEMICVELTKNSQNMIIGIADAAEGEIFVIAVYSVTTNDFDYDILAEGAEIVKSAVKTTGGAVNTAANA